MTRVTSRKKHVYACGSLCAVSRRITGTKKRAYRLGPSGFLMTVVIIKIAVYCYDIAADTFYTFYGGRLFTFALNFIVIAIPALAIGRVICFRANVIHPAVNFVAVFYVRAYAKHCFLSFQLIILYSIVIV
jgi:hypothetical protein